MESKSYDYLVIGAGSGGIASARRAAMFDKKVAVFEYKRLGGTCVNVGCVPKKLMFNTSSVIEQMESIGKYKKYWLQQKGKDMDIEHIEVNLKDFKKDRDAYIKKLNGIYQENLEKSGVDHIDGIAEFVDNHTLKCNGITYTADHILIATGSKPHVLGIEGEEYAINSDGFFDLEELPRRSLVVGGGYIACELAQILTIFGSETTILVRDKVLSYFDQEIAEKLKENFGHMGLSFIGSELNKIEKNEDGSLKATYKNGEELEVDCVLLAVGRDPLIEALKLENTDVKLDEKTKAIVTDEYENTSVKGIYAVGDVNGKIELTPVAIRAGRILSERLFNNRTDLKMNYEYVPSVIFSHPPIASVGYSEKDAKEKFGDENIEVYKTEFKNMFDSFTQGDSLKQRTFYKMVCNKADDERVVGFHGIGVGIDELLQGVAVAIKMGATKRDFDQTVAIHPTASEEIVLLNPKL